MLGTMERLLLLQARAKAGRGVRGYLILLAVIKEKCTLVNPRQSFLVLPALKVKILKQYFVLYHASKQASQVSYSGPPEI